MWRRRLIVKYFWSNSCQKLCTMSGLFTLISLLLWCFASEVLAFKLSSVTWRWPKPYPDKPAEPLQSVDADPLPFTSVRTHHKHLDTHHFVLGTYKSLVFGQRRKHRYRKKDTQLHHFLKILLISDPHIMCTHDKEEWWFARWDADHYLRKSFSYLYPRLRPDLVIFLGDVFSNGFEASQRQWFDYLQCLRETYPIFTSPTEKEKIIVATGDNDLGGEGRDYMTEIAHRRYEETFGDLNVIFEITDSMRIIKLTTTCFIRPPVTRAEIDCRESLLSFLNSFSHSKSADPSTHLTILLTHVPLNQLQSSAQFFHNGQSVNIKTKILSTLRPEIVLSGHIHHEEFTTHSLDEGQWSTNEITVPTCSYRMGELSMGVGTVVISQGGNMAYRVNWLPSRYPFIVGYVILGASLLCVCLCLACGRRKF